jgi:chromosome segregation ATPase
MKEILLALIPVVATESIALFVMLFKTIPVLQNKLEHLEKKEAQAEVDYDTLKSVVDKHTVINAETMKDYQRIASDLHDTRNLLNDNNKELRKSLDENTKAITGLEATFKVLANTLLNPAARPSIP